MEDLTEDEQLQLAIQMSLGDDAEVSLKRRRDSSTARPSGHIEGGLGKMAGSSNAGLAGLDRKAMEQERLSRAAKRVKSEASTRETKDQRHKAAVIPGVPIGGAIEGNNRSMNQRHAPARAQPSASKLQQVKGPQYIRGAIKRTWASSHPRGNDLTIEEVLQPDQLRKAALSSFQWDNEWLWSKIDLTRTNVMVILQGKTENDRREIVADSQAFNPRIKVCFPPMPGRVNCMHSKLMLLFYDSYMRIAIPTANLTQYDWGDDGRMENSVFLIDLPERSAANTQRAEDLTHFGQQLHFFLEQMLVPDHLLEAILRYDFHETRDLAFVHSIGNDRCRLDPAHCTGYPGLAQAVTQLGLQTEDVQLDMAFSSIGALKPDFLNAFYDAARGKQMHSATTLSYKTRTHHYEKRMRIHFPSEDTVANSLGGPNAAGVICLQRKWYEEPSFPRDLFREYMSARHGLLSHNKIILGRGFRSDKTSPGGSKPIAWAYLGSHNLSESAWGRVTIDKSSKEASINCKNWECGVLVPVDVAEDVDDEGFPNFNVFKDQLDIPFELPGARYDGKKPWFVQS